MLEGEGQASSSSTKRSRNPIYCVAPEVSFHHPPGTKPGAEPTTCSATALLLLSWQTAGTKGSDLRTGHGCQCCTNHGHTAEKERETLPESLWVPANFPKQNRQ